MLSFGNTMIDIKLGHDINIIVEQTEANTEKRNLYASAKNNKRSVSGRSKSEIKYEKPPHKHK